ncbi:MAG: ABC transporter substrate-binding protein [Xanthobacteraceae bacterium]|jgi:putative tryptophan/tyrosine transport system substrate-binding protein
MKRRQFIALLGGAAAWPLAGRAQQAMPVIGFLNGGFYESYAQQVAAFRQGLNEIGYVDGQNVAIDYRWANGRIDDLRPLAIELVERQVAVIVTSGGAAALAAKAATTTIPIVFNVTDPVVLGLAKSLSRPGANATGVNVLAGDLGPKRLGLLREVVPAAQLIAFLVNPNSPISALQIAQMESAAQAIGMQFLSFKAAGQDEFEGAFASLAQQRADVLVVGADPFFNTRRERLVALAARHAIPAIYEWREFVEAGGLMSYGASLKDAYRQIGLYAGQILKGAKPADLPVTQPTKFEFVINLKTAKALGLAVPNSMQLLADEVIE